MTRANFLIITENGKFNLQGNSSCYPSNTMANVIKFAISTHSFNAIFEGKLGFYGSPNSRDIAEFIDSVGLTFGKIFNASYYYEIDFVKQTIKVWDYKTRWLNAPLDWKEKGWKGCYEGKNGKWGFDNFVKGKLLYNKNFVDLVRTRFENDVNFVVDIKQSEIELAENI